MNCRLEKFRPGIMLVELVVVSAISAILILAVAVLMTDSQKGYNTIYHKTNSVVAQDDFAVRTLFSSNIRQCSNENGATTVAVDGSWIRAHYYSSSEVDLPDRYARFYRQDRSLILERGVIDPASTVSSQTVCQNVASAVFKKNGRSVFMFLTLDDGTDTREINTSAILCNP